MVLSDHIILSSYRNHIIKVITNNQLQISGTFWIEGNRDCYRRDTFENA